MRSNNLLRSAKYEAFARAKFFNQHEEKNWWELAWKVAALKILQLRIII